MEKISDFEQVRADGNVVPAGMNVAEMLARGWAPSKVIAFKWFNANNPVKYPAPDGAHGIVVPGGNFVATILDQNSSGKNSQLTILNADGSIRGTLQNSLRQAGFDIMGWFSWFEPAMEIGTDRFGAVFQTASEGEFRCDIDANNLLVPLVRRIR